LAPISFEAWIFHAKESLGEKLKIFKEKRYINGKSDSLRFISMITLFIWQIVLTKGEEFFVLEDYFGLAFFHPAISVMIIFLMLVSTRSHYILYQVKLKPYLYEIN
jgi:hypothetical protein